MRYVPISFGRGGRQDGLKKPQSTPNKPDRSQHKSTSCNTRNKRHACIKAYTSAPDAQMGVSMACICIRSCLHIYSYARTHGIAGGKDCIRSSNERGFLTHMRGVYHTSLKRFPHGECESFDSFVPGARRPTAHLSREAWLMKLCRRGSMLPSTSPYSSLGILRCTTRRTPTGGLRDLVWLCGAMEICGPACSRCHS